MTRTGVEDRRKEMMKGREETYVAHIMLVTVVLVTLKACFVTVLVGRVVVVVVEAAPEIEVVAKGVLRLSSTLVFLYMRVDDECKNRR